MHLSALLPQLKGLKVDDVLVHETHITLFLTAVRRTAPCPVCGQPARRIHSRYPRTIADLPWSGRSVSLHVQARRFFCANPSCLRKIFCERLPQLMAVYGRKTGALRTALQQIGFALGGKAGARLATTLQMWTSRMTMLRVVRTAPPPQPRTPRVLGVDDWSWRKGRTYGTLLVDLERHYPVDLLPDRTAEAFAAWLTAHPGVEIISRDRGGAYADGARQGAPRALQVADRFHLVKNVAEALEQFLTQQHSVLRQAAQAAITVDHPVGEQACAMEVPAPGAAVVPGAVQRQQERRARRQVRYDEVRTLYQQGMSLRAIARRLGLARDTVRRFAYADSFTQRVPERIPRATGPTILTPYEPYLRMRWNAGCQNTALLWREIRQQGFRGSASFVRVQLAKWRRGPARAGRPPRAPVRAPPAPPPVRTYSPRQTVWLLLKEPAELDESEATYLQALVAHCPQVTSAQTLARRFIDRVRTRDGSALQSWLDSARASDIKEFHSVAQGIRRDHAAVKAALTTEWNNGQTEGHINRLKMLKRQMFGRAGFDLLRLRVLHPT